MLRLAVALDVVLPSGEVPQEVAPVHEVHLVREEVAQVLAEGGQIAALLHAAHPRLVAGVVQRVVHTGEEHVLGIVVLRLVAHHVVTRHARLRRAAVNRRTLVRAGHHVVALLLVVQLAGVGTAVEQRGVAVLLAGQVAAQGEDVVRRVLVHRRIGARADKDNAVATVAQQYHAEAEQRRAYHSPSRPHHGHGKPHGQQRDEAEHTALVRHSAGVHAEEFHPARQPNHAGHNAVQHGGHQHRPHQKGADDAPQSAPGRAAEMPHQDHRRNAEQIEQMHADGQADKIGDEHHPAVTAGLVGLVLPLQHQPEHQRRQETGVGIDLGFHRREPERVAERIGQRAHQAAHLHQPHTCRRERAVGHHQPPRQVRNRPEEEQDAARTEQGREQVHHQRHPRGIARELREEIGRKHEEGRARRVSHLQFIARSDELGTVPQAGRGFHREAVDHGRHQKCAPPHQGVDAPECVHLHNRHCFVRCKSSDKCTQRANFLPYNCLTFS